MVPQDGIEPPTHGFSIHCSTPELLWHMARLVGVEPTCIQLTFQLVRSQRVYRRIYLFCLRRHALLQPQELLVGKCRIELLPVKERFYRPLARTTSFTCPLFGGNGWTRTTNSLLMREVDYHCPTLPFLVGSQ
jgi:hypothetical protein